MIILKSQSKTSTVKTVVQGIDERIRRVFNSDFFSIYEGIVEKVEPVNGILNIRVPELNNSLFDECRVMTFCSSKTAAVTSTYKIGTHVIVAFKAFSLNYPVVLGQISPPEIIYNPFDAAEDVMTFRSGNSTIKLSPDAITITCGKSTSMVISESGIVMNGDIITANGEDLTYDEVEEEDD